jgi:hypothetical protein
MTKYFQKIINWVKRLFGMETNKGKDAELFKEATQFMDEVYNSLFALNVDIERKIKEPSPLASMRHRFEYTERLIGLESPMDGILNINFSNAIRLKLSQTINVISQCIVFKTQIQVTDHSAQSGIGYVDLVGTRVKFEVGNKSDRWILESETTNPIRHYIVSKYLDAIIDSLNNKDNEQGQKAA